MTDVAFRIRIAAGICNVPFKVRRIAWRKCWLRTQRRSDIFGINENFTLRQRRLYQRLAREKGYGFYGTLGPNPVFWNAAKYQLVSRRRVPIHGPAVGRRARMFPGYNAGREITEVVLAVLGHPGEEVAVLCTHWVPSGVRVNAEWRQRVRAQSKAHVAGLVDKHVAAGRPTFVVGDTNIRRRFTLGKVRWLRGLGVDKVGIALPGRTEIEARRAVSFPAPTDHLRGVVGIVRLIVNPRSAA